jgi:hypothetical protein
MALKFLGATFRYFKLVDGTLEGSRPPKINHGKSSVTVVDHWFQTSWLTNLGSDYCSVSRDSIMALRRISTFPGENLLAEALHTAGNCQYTYLELKAISVQDTAAVS